MSSSQWMTESTGSFSQSAERIAEAIGGADAVLVGAGAGLSTAAGFSYGGKRFEEHFADFHERFGIEDMYSGGFYPFPGKETLWAWWSRSIWLNRYACPVGEAYKDLAALLQGRDYFVLTTNVDHQFQRAGIEKGRLFYTQGDYGLFQSADPGHNRVMPKTYDNEAWTIKAMEAQGFVRDKNGVFDLPTDGKITMRIPTELISKCPDDGSEVMMNLRADDSFVEDAGWHRASAAYAEFLERHMGQHILFMEIGVGMNTPVIIKYPFWQMTNDNEKAVYVCLNFNEAYAPAQIAERSLCIDGDTGEVLRAMLQEEA